MTSLDEIKAKIRADIAKKLADACAAADKKTKRTTRETIFPRRKRKA